MKKSNSSDSKDFHELFSKFFHLPLNKENSTMRNSLSKIVFTAVIALLLPLMSCDAAGPSALAGHWMHESGSTKGKPEDMELFKDGTGVCDGKTVSWKVENKRFIMQSPQFGIAGDYEMSGYRLTLTYNGEKVTYININNKNYLQKGSFTDSRDGKKYGTVKIGTQTWLTENLSYDANNSKCYSNDQANCQKYGRLYNWETALNVCPKNWHLPSDAEWQTLVDFVGADIAGKKLKARNGWENNGNGTDIYGFSALPGGYGNSNGDFRGVGIRGYWWSSTEHNASIAYIRYMGYNYADVDRDDDDKTILFSVRCVQD